MLENAIAIDTLWVLFCACLVFFMNAGFGCIEAGFCRSKNAVNIFGKNFVVFGLASLAFWAIGFGLMFGDGNAIIGTTGWFATGLDNSPAVGDAYQGVFGSLNWASIPLFAKFFFQLAFAATAATIVSGCVAERIHYVSFMVFALVTVGLVYPISGHWIWGGGWLQELGMWDFAGSTVVHSVGGWAGLAGILLLGPRIGKYRRDGEVSPIPGHSMALAFLGGMILWLGWFGFNPGSTMGITGDNASAVSHIFVTTNLAASAGLILATLTSIILLGKPDFSMTVNGALAGLVGITAPCAFVTPAASVAIGAIAGVLVVLGVRAFDRLRIDDPVGALSVHLICGIWGTLAVGLFATTTAPGGIDADGLFYGGGSQLLLNQAIGVVAVGAFAFSASLGAWAIIKGLFTIRVEAAIETEGLDVHEMGSEAYTRERAIDIEAIVKESKLGKHRKVIEASSGPKSPRPASQPPGTPAYSIEVRNVDLGTFMNKWRNLCGTPGLNHDQFRAVYRHFTTVEENRLRFRGGDSQEVANQLQHLAETITPDAEVSLSTDAEKAKFNVVGIK